MKNYHPTLKNAILDEVNFVRATFSGIQRGAENPWQRLVIRPVMLKNRRHLQFSWFNQKQNIVKNFEGDEALRQLDDALELPFANFTVQSANGDLQVQITKKGKVLVHQHSAKTAPAPVNLAHDREKNLLLTADSAAPFLKAVGIMTEDGKIRAAMQSKFRQINEFLRLLEDTGEFGENPLHIVDFGCGNAYLTFATYYYFREIRGIDCHLTGVDTNRQLLEAHEAKVKNLGWQNLKFEVTCIEDYVPEVPPDIVIALHACDTATDDALAQGIHWQSRVIVAVPCCHHHLQAQLNRQETPRPFGEMMRYGLIHERMGDLLTDSFRALLLRIAGYKVDVVQFVDTEHTPKNLMLRAVRGKESTDSRLLNEYEALKSFWQVTPYLEKLVLEEIQS
jgi:SAM-dependent methyltransferase